MTPRDQWPISPSNNEDAISANLAISVQAEDGGSLAEGMCERGFCDEPR